MCPGVREPAKCAGLKLKPVKTESKGISSWRQSYTASGANSP